MTAKLVNFLKENNMAFIHGTRGLIDSPFEVTVDDFNIGFIARGLSRLGRFLGTGAHFQSVAEHSVEVSRLVSPKLAVCALLHDAPECFVGDLHSGIKEMLIANNDETYKYLEQFFWELIAERYSLPFLMPDEVHEADAKAREWEMGVLFHGGMSRGCQALMPAEAEQLFLQRALELGLKPND